MQINTMTEYNAKTVFLLDHTSRFKQNSGDEIVLDNSSKVSDAKRIFRKPIWSNVTDAVLQYCRIVYDVFSSEKPFSVITFDTEEKIHSIWLDEDQTIETLWNIFSHEGPPVEFDLDLSKCARMPGSEPACNMLQMLSPTQKRNPTSSTNVGRVIVLSAQMKRHIPSWVLPIIEMLNETPESPEYAKVTASEWLFIDLDPADDLSDRTPQPIELPPDVKLMAHRFLYHRLPTNSVDLYRGLMRLVETHYNLASTLVQDIPMKEEANTNSSSAMYGVELIHQAEAHDLLRRVGLADQLLIRADRNAEEVISALQRPNSGFSKTLGIKWVTPKSADAGFLRYAIAAYRVTLADVGNRASTCLAQFVLGGRSVALAHRLPVSLPLLPQSHPEWLSTYPNNEALLLTCHGSVMYLHVLAALCPLAHPPLVALQPEARDSALPADVRLQTFISQLTRPSRLAPASARLSYTVVPSERAQQHLERSTRYWPLFETETFLGSNKLANSLFEQLPKEYLEPNEIAICEDAIDKLFNSIKHNVSLSSDTRKAGSKRGASLPVAPSLQAEAVALSVELDHLLSIYAPLSAEHAGLLRHWHTLLSSTSGATSQRANNNSDVSMDRPFAAMDLAGMVAVGRKIASGQTVPPVVAAPDQLTQTINSFKVLCKSLTQDKALASSGLPITNRSSTHKRLHSLQSNTVEQVDDILIQPVNHATFVDLLQPSKRARPDVNGGRKLEFVGVTTADVKGMCQLYRALKEKEKTAA